jgi:Domain of unknown function (DUF4806)
MTFACNAASFTLSLGHKFNSNDVMRLLEKVKVVTEKNERSLEGSGDSSIISNVNKVLVQQKWFGDCLSVTNQNMANLFHNQEIMMGGLKRVGLIDTAADLAQFIPIAEFQYHLPKPPPEIPNITDLPEELDFNYPLQSIEEIEQLNDKLKCKETAKVMAVSLGNLKGGASQDIQETTIEILKYLFSNELRGKISWIGSQEHNIKKWKDQYLKKVNEMVPDPENATPENEISDGLVNKQANGDDGNSQEKVDEDRFPEIQRAVEHGRRGDEQEMGEDADEDGSHRKSEGDSGHVGEGADEDDSQRKSEGLSGDIVEKEPWMAKVRKSLKEIDKKSRIQNVVKAGVKWAYELYHPQGETWESKHYDKVHTKFVAFFTRTEYGKRATNLRKARLLKHQNSDTSEKKSGKESAKKSRKKSGKKSGKMSHNGTDSGTEEGESGDGDEMSADNKKKKKQQEREKKTENSLQKSVPTSKQNESSPSTSAAVVTLPSTCDTGPSITNPPADIILTPSHALYSLINKMAAAIPKPAIH